jgi:hypothetical protein
MRRLVLLALAGALLWWILVRRRGGELPLAALGYDDGSALTLEKGTPELERLVAAAESALRA